MTEQQKERLYDLASGLQWILDHYILTSDDADVLRQAKAALSPQPQCEQCTRNKYPTSPNDMIPCPDNIRWNTRPGDNNALSPPYDAPAAEGAAPKPSLRSATGEALCQRMVAWHDGATKCMNPRWAHQGLGHEFEENS